MNIVPLPGNLDSQYKLSTTEDTEPEANTASPDGRDVHSSEEVEQTVQFEDDFELPQAPLPWPVTQAFLLDPHAIRFYINGYALTLPSNERMIVGRHSDNLVSVEPEVDLTNFRAQENGISRLHLRLQRVGDDIYVTDLCSKYGSFLNGRRLAPHRKELLQNGDELRLGRLIIQVILASAHPVK